MLGVAGVGIHDDFFELGGHSLHAYQVSLRVAGEIGVEMPAQTLFDAPTVAALAERLAGAPAAVAAASAPAPVSGRPLSFAQQRLWLTEVLEPGGTTYNLAVAVRLTETWRSRPWRAAWPRSCGATSRCAPSTPRPGESRSRSSSRRPRSRTWRSAAWT